MSALLGTTRATILRSAVTGCTTTRLARRAGVAPATVSHHTNVLRDAGLITTDRHENLATHLITPLGLAVLGPGRGSAQTLLEAHRSPGDAVEGSAALLVVGGTAASAAESADVARPSAGTRTCGRTTSSADHFAEGAGAAGGGGGRGRGRGWGGAWAVSTRGAPRAARISR
ncbi:winged helix-turn-helix domain-containing protein, partial [Amycolatopsis sp. NPDC026612]|uniref:ArsR/SmtB family transcription factor n=1 Tax=Amycolatopsis sp. NPDC026612 TaxID=3155466 RepID=UPI0033E816D2